MRARASQLLIVSTLALASCVSQSERLAVEDRDALINAYREQSANTETLRAWRESNRVRRLDVRRDPATGTLLLSVDLNDATLGRVIEQILLHPQVQFKASSLIMSHRVSAQFNDLPLADGMNLLLEDTGYVVEMRAGIIRMVERGSVPYETDDDSGGALVTREIRLRHLSAIDAVALVTDLFEDQESEEEHVTFAASAAYEINAVYLTGAARYVEAATRILAKADQPVAHVIIEALVVDLDITAIEELGISWSGGAAGSFSSIGITPGSIGSNFVGSFEELAGNAEQLTATIDFLASLNTVEILSRPYLATRSTHQATIEIVDDQYVRVDTSDDGSSIVSAESVSAGISMGITPTAMADGTIRMDLTLEESKFAATFGDAIITKERNSSATSMSVQSGQTIIIGGLNSEYRSTANAGLPWLRKIPILNFLTASQSTVGLENQLVVYLTPYVWTPGMETPMPRTGALGAGESVLTGIERRVPFE